MCSPTPPLGLMEWGTQLQGTLLGSQTPSPCPPTAPAAQGSAPGTFSSILQPQGLCQALSGSAAHSRSAPWDQILFTLAKLDPDLLLPLKQTNKQSNSTVKLQTAKAYFCCLDP